MDFLLTPPTRSTPGFVTPPLDGSLTVPEFYDFHYEHNKDHTVFRYADNDGATHHLTFADVVPAAHNAARYVAKLANIDLQNSEPRRPVAILAATDTITFFTTILGMLRAEIPIFLISPRNSLPAVAHLLGKISPSHVLVSTEKAIQELVNGAVAELKEEARPGVTFMPKYEDIFIPGVPLESLPPRKRDLEATRIIVHSSGSTSFPKPIIWTDKSFLQAALTPLLGAHDFYRTVYGTQSITMFHGIGINYIGWLSTTGFIMSTFPPVTPAVTPTPDAVWNATVAASPDYLFAPPFFFEGWSHDKSKMEFFKTMKGIVYGGAPLQKNVGDVYAKAGVGVYTLYGSTECGVYGTIFPEHPGLDWEYITMNPHCATEFVSLGDGTYELVVVAKPITELAVLNTTYDGIPAYSTSDILIPHPTKPDRWKVVGRIDDQIMLNTGEKTNPGPLEAILCQHPIVASAIMFGRGKFQNGVLIETKEEYAFDTYDKDKLQEYRDKVWPKVEEMNATAPQHSRLFKEMIIFADPSKPFSYTPKGSPRRAIILSDYNEEIEALYAEVEQSAQIQAPSEWTPEASLQFIRQVVNGVLKSPAKDEDDIFERGVDSLQATWIRQNIVVALRSTDKADATKITPNFVYEKPSIKGLTEYVLSVLGIAVQNGYAAVDRIADLNSLVTSYSENFATHKPQEILNAKTARNMSHPGQQDVVLITGTTGGLGSATLARLVASDDVAKIYVLIRPSKQGIDATKRQEEALKQRGYDGDIVKSSKVILIEEELTPSGLRIHEELLEEIRTSITHIFHIGWRVDFNLSLASFDHIIGGVRALVDLALSSPRPMPPQILFTSTVGVYRNNLPDVPIREVQLEDPTITLGQGYPESKWVAERIFRKAAKTTPLRSVVIRVGQISGGINGSWNATDWVPAIVKSSLKIGFLPDLKGSCSWVPLDFAAQTLVDFRSANPTSGIVHLVHPKPIRCSAVMKVIGEEMGLPIRSYAEWVATLEDLAGTLNDDTLAAPGQINGSQFSDPLPAAKTLEFFRSGLARENDDWDAMAIPPLDVTEALAASKILRENSEANQITPDGIRSWLKYWREIGFLPVN